MAIPQFDAERFCEFIHENKAIAFLNDPVTLKSGRHSHVYINWSRIADDVYLVDQLTDFIVSFVHNLGFAPDCFYGVPEDATKIALLTQYKWARSRPDYQPGRYPLPMGRGKAKDHGMPQDRYFMGVPQGRAMVLEATAATGASLLTTIAELQEGGVEVIGAIALADRNELRDDRRTVSQALAAKQISYYSMSGLIALLPEAYRRQAPGEPIAAAIESYFKLYGSRPLNLVQ